MVINLAEMVIPAMEVAEVGILRLIDPVRPLLDFRAEMEFHFLIV